MNNQLDFEKLWYLMKDFAKTLKVFFLLSGSHSSFLVSILKNKWYTDLSKQCVIFTDSNKRNTMTIQPAFTCSKLTIETLKQGLKYVQS